VVHEYDYLAVERGESCDRRRVAGQIATDVDQWSHLDIGVLVYSGWTCYSMVLEGLGAKQTNCLHRKDLNENESETCPH
jgi:hypothetical protein